jgi:hypothetical protein
MAIVDRIKRGRSPMRRGGFANRGCTVFVVQQGASVRQEIADKRKLAYRT